MVFNSWMKTYLGFTDRIKLELFEIQNRRRKEPTYYKQAFEYIKICPLDRLPLYINHPNSIIRGIIKTRLETGCAFKGTMAGSVYNKPTVIP